MNELLLKLLESELLTPETKTQLDEAFKAHQAQLDEQVATAVAAAKETIEEEVRTSLAAQYNADRDRLIEAADAKLSELFGAEVADLHKQIQEHQDQEVVYAGKLQEAKEALAEQYKQDIASLIAQLDTFLQESITSEFDELKAQLVEARQNHVGRKIIEAFKAEFMEHFVDENAVQKKLEEAEAKLAAVQLQLAEAANQRAAAERAAKMESLLAPLSGTQKQLMETILSTVETKDLEKAHGKFIGRVLKEGAAPATKEDKVLEEGVKPAANAVAKTGDELEKLTETKQTDAAVSVLSEAEKRQLRRLAGIDQ